MKSLSTAVALAVLLPLAPVQSQETPPPRALESRILQIEVDSLLDAYAGIFREQQDLRLQRLRIQIELESGNPDREALGEEMRRIEITESLTQRHLDTLRAEILGKANAIRRTQAARRQQEREEPRTRRDQTQEEVEVERDLDPILQPRQGDLDEADRPRRQPGGSVPNTGTEPRRDPQR